MKRLVDTRYVNIITNNQYPQISESELDIVVDEFVDQVIGVCSSEADYISIYRTLNYTRICLKTLQGEYTHQHKAKKKCRNLSKEYSICFGHYRSGTSVASRQVG